VNTLAALIPISHAFTPRTYLHDVTPRLDLVQVLGNMGVVDNPASGQSYMLVEWCEYGEAGLETCLVTMTMLGWLCNLVTTFSRRA
jgi:hypothetical protein